MRKRVSRINPASDWVIEAVSDLCIIEQEQWDRVRTRLDGIRQSARSNDASF
jgi:hypothetical protein